MRLPRMTTRRWMILVAVVGVALAARVWQNRSVAWRAYCREMGQYHANFEEICRSQAEGLSRSAAKHTESAEDMTRPEKDRRIARYCAKLARRGASHNGIWKDFHGRMKAKWQLAANSLWMNAEPDPPAPEP
jgi:hypothetical protein